MTDEEKIQLATERLLGIERYIRKPSPVRGLYWEIVQGNVMVVHPQNGRSNSIFTLANFRGEIARGVFERIPYSLEPSITPSIPEVADRSSALASEVGDSPTT